MSRPGPASSARAWWAAPSALAVVAALAFAVGFAPRLAQHVRVPAAVTVGGPAVTTSRIGAGTPGGHPSPAAPPRPSRTPQATQQIGPGGTVVQPLRPVVTARPFADDGERHDAGTSRGDGPTPSRTDGGTAGGDR